MIVDRSVFLMTSANPNTAAFGTAFFTGRDAGGRAYVVTCAHVVKNVGGTDAVHIGGKCARVVAMGSPDGADDIAVLETDVPGDALPLRLGQARAGGRACTVIGYRKLYGGVRQARAIDGVFESATLTTEGRQIAGWNLRMEDSLPDGYSGSPVLDTVSGEVIGVASLSFAAGPGAVGQELRREISQELLAYQSAAGHYRQGHPDPGVAADRQSIRDRPGPVARAG